MATRTKTTAKKASQKNVVKAPARKPTKRTVKTANRADSMQSFHMAKSDKPFFTLQPDRQTVYWTVLALCVLGLGVWMIDINQKVLDMYDHIDRQTISNDTLTAPEIKELESQKKTN